MNQKLNDLIVKAIGNRSRNQFALRSGISAAALSRYLSGERTAQPSVLKKISLFAHNGVTYEQLMEAAGYIDSRSISESDYERFPSVEIVSFPVIGYIRAGYDGIAEEIDTGEVELVPRVALRGLSEDSYFVLRVQGDSMYPDFRDGDNVLVKRQSSVDSGSIAVVMISDECATLKRVIYRNGEDWFRLEAVNPTYPPVTIRDCDLEQCRILGLVVKLFRQV